MVEPLLLHPALSPGIKSETPVTIVYWDLRGESTMHVTVLQKHLQRRRKSRINCHDALLLTPKFYCVICFDIWTMPISSSLLSFPHGALLFDHHNFYIRENPSQRWGNKTKEKKERLTSPAWSLYWGQRKVARNVTGFEILRDRAELVLTESCVLRLCSVLPFGCNLILAISSNRSVKLWPHSFEGSWENTRQLLPVTTGL